MYKALILVFALFLTGCGAAATGAPSATALPVPTTAPAETATPVATTAPATTQDDEVVAVWTRSGGFAGTTDRMTVYADGRLVIEPDRGQTQTVQGDAGAVQALHELVVGSDWQSLDGQYGNQFPDAFAYRIEAGGKTVDTFDGIETPEILTQVMQQLGQLYNAATRPAN